MSDVPEKPASSPASEPTPAVPTPVSEEKTALPTGDGVLVVSPPGAGPSRAIPVGPSESGETTNIDRELSERLRAKYGDDAEPVPQGASGADSTSTERPTPEAIGSGSATHPTVDALGPAFPDLEAELPAAQVESVADSVPAAPAAEPLPSPTEVPTSARSAVDTGLDRQLRNVRDSARAAMEDGWAGFQDKAEAWRSVTGESQVVVAQAAVSGPEYSRRNTNVYKLGKGPKIEEGARLVCIAGADVGREFAIVDREVSIGRGPSNSIVLADASVSREHARLLHEGDNYILVDLRSANGTYASGQRIDRAKIRSGDEIAFGSVRFRFLEIGDVFKPVDASGAPVLPGARRGLWTQLRESPHFVSVLWSAGILLGTLILTAAIVLLRTGDPGVRSRRDTVFQYYLQGVEAFKRRQWADAEGQFNVILGLEPNHVRGQRYLQEVLREKELERRMDAAKQARSAGDLAQAYTQAAGIVDSVYTAEARELLRGIDLDLDARVARARAALQAGQPEQALPLLDSIELVRPGRPDVQALRDRAGRHAMGGTAATPAPVEVVRPKVEAPRLAPPPVRVEERPTAKVGGVNVIERATAEFGRGGVSEALRLTEGDAQNRDAQVLKAKISKFQEIYAQASDAHRGKRPEDAIRLLKQAKAFEAKVTGGESALAVEIDRKLADMYFVQGVGNYVGARYPEAYRDFRTAVTFDPDHRPSQKKLDDLVQKAKELLDEGVRLKASDSGKAKERFLTVMQIVPTSHDYYRKAKERLDALR